MSYRPPLRKNRVSVPEHAHPIARLVFFLMRESGKTYDALEYESGVLRCTIKSWRNEKLPGLRSAEAVLGALGWGLAPYPQMESLPPHVREMTEELGQHFLRDDHALAAAVAAAITKPEARCIADGPAPRIDYREKFWLPSDVRAAA